jgi:hypothetical protein
MTKTTAFFGLLCLLATAVGAKKQRNLNINYMLGSICGSVKEDTNGDGVGDVNLGDVTVTIFDSYDYEQGSTTTDKNGNYCFYNLDRNEYVIIETNPSGYTDVSDAEISVFLLAGQAMTGQDFVDKKLIVSPIASAPPTGSYACVLPPGATSYSLISYGDAQISAHDVYTPIIVGGILSGDKYGKSGNIAGNTSGKSYVKGFDGNAAEMFNNFPNGGVETISDINNSPVDWKHFEWLAKNVVGSEADGFKVVVLSTGGTYNLYDFRNGGQGEDNGSTLVIFNTHPFPRSLFSEKLDTSTASLSRSSLSPLAKMPDNSRCTVMLTRVISPAVRVELLLLLQSVDRAYPNPY